MLVCSCSCICALHPRRPRYIREHSPFPSSNVSARVCVCLLPLTSPHPPLAALDLSSGTLAAHYYRSVRASALANPTKEAVLAVGQDVKLSFSGLDRLATGYALGMLDVLGLKAGSKLGLWLGNELENGLLQFSAGLLGVTVVLIDPALDYAGVLKVVEAEQLRALMMAPRHAGDHRLGRVAGPGAFDVELAPFKTSFTGYVPFTAKRFREFKWLVQTGVEPVDGVVRLRDIPVMGNGGLFNHDMIAAVNTGASSGAVAVVPYTAGASGAPVRGTPLTHANVVATATSAASALRLTETDTVVTTAPLYNHVGFAAGVLAGSSVSARVLLPGKDFDAVATLTTATKQRASVLVATAHQVEALVEAAAMDAAKPVGARVFDLSSLRAGFVCAFVGVGSCEVR